jgi:hypothetical protein
MACAAALYHDSPAIPTGARADPQQTGLRTHTATQRTYSPTDSLSDGYRHNVPSAWSGQPQRAQMERKRKKQQNALFVTAFVAILLLCIVMRPLKMLYISILQ